MTLCVVCKSDSGPLRNPGCGHMIAICDECFVGKGKCNRCLVIGTARYMPKTCFSSKSRWYDD